MYKYLTIALVVLIGCTNSDQNQNSDVEPQSSPDPRVEGPKNLVGYGLVHVGLPEVNSTIISTDTVFRIYVDLNKPVFTRKDIASFLYEGENFRLGSHVLNIEDHLIEANQMRVDLKLNGEVELEDGEYPLIINVPTTGEEYIFEYRKESKAHVAGILIERDYNSDDFDVSLKFSEPVLIENQNQICIASVCNDSSSVGQSVEVINLNVNENLELPFTINIDSNMSSVISSEHLSIMSWQQNNPKYEHIFENNSSIEIEFQEGVLEWSCGERKYCWGQYANR